MTDDELSQLSLEVGQRLQRLHATVTTAESCTGGWIAKVLTDTAGSSQWFERGFVTYSNDAKQALVGVSQASLESFGAVSEQVVREMAEGALKQAGAQYAVAVSGIAGPDGGTAEKPVGTVWFGLAAAEANSLAQRKIFAGDRASVRRQATAHALLLLRDHFLKN
ncbi:nicotinamide-nucleotide amidase [Erwinia phyllosphaerae]|uniref:nicotinamide-nucleotide amidase n=1 Tax=Erwinia phyllosphaerae TaxID=2853256 RepID=UPI001FF079F7|nr:nicotinamide-nucleotide amidase [Erwinia phyllosphaerae]MBV4368901.1 nicotinamide-nucleotide amidase [Erwinia phyllosphaerae]